MSLDQLEPLAWADFSQYLLPAGIAGLLLMLLSGLPLYVEVGKKREWWSAALFGVGIVTVVAAVAAPQIFRALPADEAVRNNAAVVTAWAETEYGVSIKDELAQYLVKGLDEEGTNTRKFKAQTAGGERTVWIEVIEGELRLMSTAEMPRTSDKP